jgi:DNA (cytosine-5)-methyltransferase 1
VRVLDLFAGIGGFSLGLHRAGGFETVAFAETDPYASRVLEARFPGVPNVGDVTTAEYPNADIICAGFPCQDISFAGAGAGLAGARSGLWREVVRAIRVVRPSFAILENVAALLSRGMGTVLGDLAEVGHDAEWHCIPASAVGAPHRRDRIWIIANPGSEQHEGRSAPFSGALAAELSRVRQPTPRATDGNKGSRTVEGALRELNRGRNLDLGTIARLWPTPTANEDAAGTPNGKMQKMLGNHPDGAGRQRNGPVGS